MIVVFWSVNNEQPWKVLAEGQFLLCCVAHALTSRDYGDGRQQDGHMTDRLCVTETLTNPFFLRSPESGLFLASAELEWRNYHLPLLLSYPAFIISPRLFASSAFNYTHPRPWDITKSYFTFCFFCCFFKIKGLKSILIICWAVNHELVWLQLSDLWHLNSFLFVWIDEWSWTELVFFTWQSFRCEWHILSRVWLSTVNFFTFPGTFKEKRRCLRLWKYVQVLCQPWYFSSGL